jgi:hypothetical protein
MTLPIAVIESRWDDGSLNPVSVRTFFELLGALYEGNPGNFHYEMFSCREALQEIIPRIGRDKRFRYGYVACHGQPEGLCAHNGDLISRTVLRNLLTQCTSLKGLHLATCSFGTPELVRFFFEVSDLSIRWVSGYREVVGWAKSSPLDLMFLHLLLDDDTSNFDTERDKISYVARRTQELMPGACEELGFSVYVRDRRGSVIDLISDRRTSSEIW